MNDSGVLANSGPAPPPPPPPPVAGQVPALRISTASELGGRRGPPSAEAYEPPAAIQNAMMTKDKKPFTYTPGMGGKLDLSQIRSPRMARRVAKNANDEGIEGPPKMLDQPDSPYQQQQQQQPTFYSSPQVAVPVFPQNQQPVQLRNSCLPRNPDRAEPRPQVRIETTCRANPPASEQTPTPPTSPTQVTLAKAPTPWMQKQVKQQEQLPEWAKRAKEPTSEISDNPQLALVGSNPTTPPTPQQQPQRFVPQSHHMRPVPAPAPERTVPMRIEDRPSVFSVINDPNSGQHHQLTNSNPHHMSRWGNPVGQSGYQGGPAVQVVPIQQQQQQPDNHYNQSQNQMQYRNVPDNRATPRANYSQPEPGPLQSNSFRVLQKITDTYNPDQQFADGEQMRKLQLTEDDRYLMNKFKEQVDGDTYLHQEEDPRYRGAAIPSRAFRYLQNMTDSAPDLPQSTTRPANATPKKPNRQSNTFAEVQPTPYIPASQQQVQEPKKYTGGAIPSRSFRILQQMTTPESIGCPWRPQSSTAADPPHDRCADEHSTTCVSPAPEERHVNDDRCVEPEETRKEDSEDEEDADSSDSTCDSESYWAYSTGLNPRGNRTEMSGRASTIETKGENSDSTDCEKLDVELEDDRRKNEEDEDAEVTVSVSLPLRFKAPTNENPCNHECVDTSVDFTLRRTISREVSREESNEQPQTPKFVITDDSVADDDCLQVAQARETTDKSNGDFLRVRSTSRDEATDDEDSGVCTSDLHASSNSRISENDTDTECKPLPSSPKRQAKKYDRAQTHSRLFKLLSDEQLRPSTPHHRRDNDSYYQTWRSQSPIQVPQIAPRVNVFCPRTNSAKNVPRIFAPRNQGQVPKSCLTPARIAYSPIPTAIRLNRRY